VNVVTKKLLIQGANTYNKSYSKNGAQIVEEEDIGGFYLTTNLDGIDISNFFLFYFSISSSLYIDEVIDIQFEATSIT
jgi:hypothetical protein